MTTQNNAVEGEVVKPIKKTKEEKALDIKRQDIQLAKAEAVATTTTSAFNPIVYTQLKQLATDLIAGGATSADAKTPEQLVVKMQSGYELGMTPVESLNSLYIVNGRVTIWGAALIKRLRIFGWNVKYKDESAEECTIIVTKGDEVIEDTFYFKDAQDSGYTTGASGLKIGWKQGQNRKLKMRYGAASQLVKTYLPEVLGAIAGIKEIDEDAPNPVEDVDPNTPKAKWIPSVTEKMSDRQKEILDNQFQQRSINTDDEKNNWLWDNYGVGYAELTEEQAQQVISDFDIEYKEARKNEQSNASAE